MTTNNRYTQYAGKIDSTEITSVIGAEFSDGIESELATPLGSVDPNASFLLGGAPAFRFDSHLISTLITTVPISGFACVTAFEIGYLQRAAQGEMENAGQKYTAAKCFMVPESISFSKGGVAVITVSAYPYSADGTTQPVVTSAAVVAGTPAETEKHTLGAVTINSTPYIVSGATLNFGISVQPHRSNAHLYPTSYTIIGRQPTVDLQVEDLSKLSDSYIKGAEVDNLVINTLALSATGGGFAGAGNKSFTIAKAFVKASSSGSHGSDASMSLRAWARKSGATAIVVVA